MLKAISEWFETDGFMPHGMCILWRPDLLWAHAVSDILIGLSYFAVAIAVAIFLHKRDDIPFPGFTVMFGFVIFAACGATHWINAWTLWNPDYGVAATIKVFTAVASVATAGLLWPVVPRLIALPSRAELEIANAELSREIKERRRVEAEVLQANAELERRVAERTEELRAKESVLSAVFDNVPVSLVVKTLDRRVDMINATYRAWYGEEAAIVEGQLTDVIDTFDNPEDLELMKSFETQVVATGKTFTREANRTFADGKPHPVRLSKFPVYDPDGEIIRIGTVGVDLTDQIAAQKALQESEERFRDFALATSDWFWEMDEELRFTYLSDRFFEITDLKPEDLIGKTREISGLNLDDPAVAQNIDDLKNMRPFTDFEHTRTRPDGRKIHMATAGRPIFDDEGMFKGYRGVGRDVTDRKEIEDALAQQTRFLDSVIEHIPIMIFAKDAKELRFTLMNRAGEELLGRPREEFLGRKELDLFTEEQARYFDETDRQALEMSGPLDIPHELVETRYKGRRILHTRKIVIRDDNGTPQYVLGISEDITDRLSADAELSSALEKANRANRAKNEFLAHMSHELRTPLNAIIGFAQMLTIGSLGDRSDKYREYAGDILASGEHLLELISDILDISRIEAGEFKMEETDIKVTDPINDALRILKYKASEKAHAIALDIAEADIQVRCDDRLLRQMLVNLLSNAIKFTPRQGNISVAVTRRADGSLAIAVADNGPGIAPEDLERILEPFGQGTTNSALAVEGTGLGLSLTKMLIELHGGELIVESQLNAGTTVTLTLPADRVLD